MNRVFLFLLGVEVVIAVVLGWHLEMLIGWQHASGPAAFPGSPDAGAIFDDIQSTMSHSRGALLGVWIGAGAAAWIELKRDVVTVSKWLIYSVLLVPPAALGLALLIGKT